MRTGVQVGRCYSAGSHLPAGRYAMKITDLEKNKGNRIVSRMQQAMPAARLGQAAGVPLDRRERRQQDQALGLVPFAVKLHSDLANRLREQAQHDGVSLNELVDRLLRQGLEPTTTTQA